VSDPEERNYLLELLEEQNERSESIIKAEDQRLSKELELLNVKCQITEDLYNLKEQYDKILDETEEMGSPAPKRKALVAGAENGRQVDLAHHLEEEEKRTNQMKTLIQKLLMANPNGCLNYDDEEIRKRNEEMLIRCGEDLSVLRKDKKEMSE